MMNMDEEWKYITLDDIIMGFFYPYTNDDIFWWHVENQWH